MKNNQDYGSVYTSLIASALILLIIFGLSIKAAEVDTSTVALSNMQGTDLIPSIKDLDPSVKTEPISDRIAFGNYTFYFENNGASFSGVGATIAGFFANILFSVAVLFSKLFSFLINFSLNSTIISDTLGGFIDSLGEVGGSFLTKMFYLILPIVYGLWAIFKGLIQKKYVVAIAGIAGAVMIYAIGMYLSTDGDKVLRAMTKTSSGLSKEVMTISTSNKGDPTVAINDDIWLSQIYIPWSIMQFGELGLSLGKDGQTRDENGNLTLNISMNEWEREELQKGLKNDEYTLIPSVNVMNDWSSTLFGRVEANSEGKALIEETLNSPKNIRVAGNQEEGIAGRKISPLATLFNSLLLMCLNFGQMIIIGIPSIIVILADAIMSICMVVSYFILFIALIPNHGTRIFKSWVMILISCFILKIVYGFYAGMSVAITTQVYISMFKKTGGSTSAIFSTGIVTGFVGLGLLGLGWILYKKVGVISLGTMAGNMALGRTDKVKEQWNEMKGRFDEIDLFKGKYNPLRPLADNADFNKYIRGINPEDHIYRQLHGLKQANNGELTAKQLAELDAVISQADKLQTSTINPQQSNKLRGLSLEGRKFKAEMNKNKLHQLANGYMSGEVSLEQYTSERREIKETIQDLISSGDRDSRKIGNELNDVLIERDAEINQKKIEDFINENPFNSASFADRRLEFFSLLDSTERAAQDGINNTDNQKTANRMTKIKAFVEEQERQLFINDYSKTADSHKLDFLREHLEDERFGIYARREYENHKLSLLDKTAETITDSHKREFWKSEIAKETDKDETIRDNKVIEHAKKKLEIIEFADLDQQNKLIQDTGIIYSDEQLKGLVENAESYLRDVAISGHMKQQAESILGKARMMQSISELSQFDPQLEIDSLWNMIQLPEHKDHTQIITQRLADLESNQFKTDVLDMLRNGSVQQDQYFAELRTSLSKELSNVTADQVWINEVIARKQQALDLISKDIDGYLGRSVPATLELQLHQFIEQMSQSASGDLQPFIQSIREKIETQSIENATALLGKIKDEIFLGFTNANETVKQELQAKFDVVTVVKEEVEKLAQKSTVNNERNFEDGSKGFNF